MTVWLSHFISVLYDRLSLTLIQRDEQFRNTHSAIQLNELQ